MSSTQDTLSFLPAFRLMIGIAAFVGFLVGLMFFLNTKRNEQVVEEYTQETNEYINRNEPGLTTLFSEDFNRSLACQTLYDAQKTECYIAVRLHMYSMISNDLKDFSSSFFIRLNQGEVQNLQLNGQASSTSFTNNVIGEKQEKVLSLLRDEVNRIPWDDYFWTMSGKEVVVPVDYQGKRIGAIVRRVIE